VARADAVHKLEGFPTYSDAEGLATGIEMYTLKQISTYIQQPWATGGATGGGVEVIVIVLKLNGGWWSQQSWCRTLPSKSLAICYTWVVNRNG
jgi:hypothetical protein